MNIYLGSDHAGFGTKEKLKIFLEKKKIKFKDLGPDSEMPVDYLDYARKVARKVVKEKGSRGILVCGSGTGMAIAANKVKGARAVAAYDIYTAKMSRKDNDANILALRGRLFQLGKTKRIIQAWLSTSFSGEERHKRRIRKIE